MKNVFEELANFLEAEESTYFYDGQFDQETLRSLIMGFAEAFESRIH
jgi:hypothetical protein